MTIAQGLLRGFVLIPIWLYLLYKILIMVEATELMWFLYWIYVPASVMVAFISAFCDGGKK